jgi:hypothetical protein
MANGSKRKAALKVRQKNVFGNNAQVMLPRYSGVKKERKSHFIEIFGVSA